VPLKRWMPRWPNRALAAAKLVLVVLPLSVVIAWPEEVCPNSQPPSAAGESGSTDLFGLRQLRRLDAARSDVTLKAKINPNCGSFSPSDSALERAGSAGSAVELVLDGVFGDLALDLVIEDLADRYAGINIRTG